MDKIISRLCIVRYINESTPACVLSEILNCHNYTCTLQWVQQNHTQCVNIVKSCANMTVHIPLCIDDYRKIARFVNADENVVWDKSSLIQAFNFLVRYYSSFDIPSKLVMGPQTPDNIQSLNCCVLYRICCHHNIPLCKDTSAESMFFIVTLLQSSQEAIIAQMRSLSKTQLLCMIAGPHGKEGLFLSHVVGKEGLFLSHVVGKSKKNEITPAQLQQCYYNMSDKEFLRNNIEPRNNIEALTLAAMNYGIDLSCNSNPMKAYYEIKKEESRSLCTFNPLFPSCFYTKENLLCLLHEEGFCVNNVQDPYALMHKSFLMPNFFSPDEGIYSQLCEKKATTFIYHSDISSLPSHSIVTWGREEILAVFTFMELAHHFRIMLRFCNPLNKEILPDHCVGKLKNMCHSVITPQWEKDHILVSDIPLILEESSLASESRSWVKSPHMDRAYLLRCLREVELYAIKASGRSNELVCKYRENIHQRRKIEKILYLLLDISMFMRGWDGKSAELPIAKAPVDNRDVADMEYKICQSIALFNDECRSFNETGNLIMSLPLFRYKNNDYYPGTDIADGLTIGGRLNIVIDKNNGENVKACIRLTSNWIAASAHRYITLLGLKPPFDIKMLADIS